MRALVLFLFLTCAFSAHAEDHKIADQHTYVDQHTYKDAKFNCSVAELSKSEDRKTLMIETKDQTGYFDFPGVNFMVKVDVDNRVVIAAMVSTKPDKPYGMAEGQNWVRLDVINGVKGNPDYIWDTATCSLIGDGH
ncbi:MAG: hypothetical protein WAU90_04545 [Methyloceanibacter sp.]